MVAICIHSVLTHQPRLTNSARTTLQFILLISLTKNAEENFHNDFVSTCTAINVWRRRRSSSLFIGFPLFTLYCIILYFTTLFLLFFVLNLWQQPANNHYMAFRILAHALQVLSCLPVPPAIHQLVHFKWATTSLCYAI